MLSPPLTSVSEQVSDAGTSNPFPVGRLLVHGAALAVILIIVALLIGGHGAYSADKGAAESPR